MDVFLYHNPRPQDRQKPGEMPRPDLSNSPEKLPHHPANFRPSLNSRTAKKKSIRPRARMTIP